MAWITPKVDWNSGTGAAVYDGDYFNAVDYNRIRNNLLELTSLAEQLYAGLVWESSIGGEKTYTSWLYADEVNALEKRLHNINDQTVRRNIGTMQVFFENGRGIDAAELNRIESACALLYDTLANQAGGRRMLRFTLGIPAGSIRG